MSKYPECDKWGGVADEASVIEDFASWLSDEKGIHFCETGEFGFYPCGTAVSSLIYEYYEIDVNKLESERRAILQNGVSEGE